MPNYKEYIPFVVILLLLGVCAYILKPFFLAIFMGGLLAYLCYPLYIWLTSRWKKPTLVAIIICLVAIVILLVPTLYIINTLIHESYGLYTSTKYALANGLFANCSTEICLQIEEYTQNPILSQQVQIFVKWATTWIVERGSGLLVSLPRFFLNVFVVFFTMFYFLRDGPRLVTHLNEYLGMPQNRYNHVIMRLQEVTKGLLYGYVLIAFLQGILGAIGFYLFGIPSPLFWGLVMALFALIPLLGTGIVWVPASIFLLLQGLFENSNFLIFKGIGLFLYGLIIVSSIDNILKPKIMGHHAKIHPAIVMIGILGGVFVFGPVGALVGPFILALTIILLEEYVIVKQTSDKV